MSLETRVVALAEAIGADIKTLATRQGDLTSLTTTAKGNLVAALNELKSAVDAASGGGAGIDDEATDTGSTWSSSKISTQIDAAVSALVDGAGDTLNTLNELAAALGNDASFAATVAAALGNRVRYDAAQMLDVTQKAQACENIGVGNPERDFAADYAAAKA